MIVEFEAEYRKGEIISRIENSQLDAYNLIFEDYLNKELEIELTLIEKNLPKKQYKEELQRQLEAMHYYHSKDKRGFRYRTPKGTIWANILSSRDVGEIEEVSFHIILKYKIVVMIY